MSRLPMSVLKMLVTVPALLVSGVLGLMALAVMPPVLGALGFVAAAAGLVLLATGLFETEAVQLLTRSRAATAGERGVLNPVLWAYGGLSTAPATPAGGRTPGSVRVFVRRRVGAATPPMVLVGRQSVVVTPWLIEATYRGWISHAEAAAVVAHAVGRHQGTEEQLEVALQVATLPWRGVAAVAHGIGRAFAWFPFMRFAWSIRGIVAVVALVQAFTDPEPTYVKIAGVLGALFVAVTYVVPAAGRALASHLEAAGDRVVVARGLGEVMSRLLRRADLPVGIERLQRLEQRTQFTPPVQPVPVLQLATFSAN